MRVSLSPNSVLTVGTVLFGFSLLSMAVGFYSGFLFILGLVGLLFMMMGLILFPFSEIVFYESKVKKK